MQFWAAGLETRASAKRAAKWGGWACLIAAARELVGIVATLLMTQKAFGQAIAFTIGASIVPIIFATAGARLLRGAGRLSGSVAVLLMVLDLLIASGQGMSPDIIGQLTAAVVLLAFMLNGLRGAFALRAVDYNAELGDTFN